MKDKKFMKHKGKVIYYNRKLDNEIYYVLHIKGENVYFNTYEEAMEYIEKNDFELIQAREYFHLTDDDMKRLDKKVIENWIAENEKKLTRNYHKDLMNEWREEIKHLKVLLEKG